MTDEVITNNSKSNRKHHILVASLIAIGVGPIVVLLHEYAHALTQLAFGVSSTVRALSADPSAELPPMQEGWEAAAGPLFSLVSGLIVWTLARALRGGAFQVALWFYIAGIQNFAGYLLITPFGVGDSAVVREAWGWPVAAQFIMMAIGIATMFGLAALVAFDLRARYDSVADFRMAAVWPWLFATVVLVVLAGAFAISGGYEAGAIIAMAMSMASMFVTAPMAAIFWNLARHKGVDGYAGPLALGVVLAVVGLGLWLVHALVGVTMG